MTMTINNRIEKGQTTVDVTPVRGSRGYVNVTTKDSYGDVTGYILTCDEARELAALLVRTAEEARIPVL